METEQTQEFVQNRNIDLRDFSRGFFEAAKLYKDNLETRSGSGISAVAGFITLFPERINYQSLNKSPEFHRLCAATYIAVMINDYMDMQSHLNTPEGEGLKSTIEDNWKKALEGIGFKKEMPESDRSIIKSYMAGVTLLDDYERSHPDRSTAGVIKYKDLENALSLVHCAALVLGPEEFDPDCLKTYEDVTLDQIEEKYAWIIDRNPENEVQRRLCAILDVVMLTQTIDDQYDYKIDNKLQIRNIYSSLLSECNGDQNLADERLEEIQEGLQEDAKKFGISHLATLGNKTVIKLIKTTQYAFPDKYGGYRERLLK